MTDKYPIGIFYVIVLIQFCCLGFNRGDSCPALQYLESGHVGTISCTFVDGFTLIAWYDSLDYKQTDPVIELRGTTKSGIGLRSNEYDVELNGSLIIKEVTINHETSFTVRVFRSNQEFPSTFHTDVITTVTPNKPFPVIYGCHNIGEICVTTSHEDSEFVCGIEGAKPGIPVSWMLRTPNGDRNISFNHLSSNDSNYFSSLKDPFTESSILVLLVCQAEDRLQMLKRDESLILIENHKNNLPTTPDKRINIERGKTAKLQCTKKSNAIFLWKRIKTNDVIVYGINMEETITKVYDEHFRLGSNGSLLIPSVTVADEGSYACIYNDGKAEGIILVDISVIVNPEPSYLSVEGCNPDIYCTLQIKREGTLKCEVKGIRPIVTLEWIVLGEDSNLLKFGDQINTINRNEGTSDVTLTTQFIAKPTTTNRVRVECLATGENAHLFQLSVVLDLILVEGLEPHTATPIPDKNGFLIVTVSLLAGATLLALIIIIIYLAYRKATRPTMPYVHKEEEVAMLNQDKASELLDKKTLFITQLKGSYENLYSGIQPIPYLKDRITVNSIFIDGGVEYLVTDQSIKCSNWQPIESYKCITSDSRVSSTRHILEAEPGYGKSTLTLQLAYEWCGNVKGSILENVDILILVKLRQLRGVSSIYDAIKRSILPRDSTLTIEDVKTLLLDEPSKSVFVILDGFDEFSNVGTMSKSNVFDILNRRMFTSFEVLLTTRSSCLPNEYAPQTKRIRLTGFDKTAQDKYLKKVVTKDDESATSRVKEALNDNPILVDLCQVPLFFVMFAHLYRDNEDIRNCTSVTKFFRYLISSLHNHFKRKMDDQNVEFASIFDHKPLDKVAFEGLAMNTKQDEWTKDELIEQLGREFIEQYLSIGILREFKVTEVIDDPGTLESDHVKCITKVKFYHRLFCEWYAAHYIADKIDKNIATKAANPTEILESLDPNKFDFIYRFVCGINQSAAKSIIQYLQDMKGRDKFAMLCILEQSGSVDQIIHNVEYLCSREMLIGSQDTRLLQRSIIQIMEIASSRTMAITSLWLENCVEYAGNCKDGIVLKSSTIRVPVLKTLGELCIEERGRDVKNEEVEKILHYCLKCSNLQIIKFNRCLLPYSLETTGSMANLKARNVKVLWYPQLLWYQLNLDRGTWKFKESDLELQYEEYMKEVEGIREMNRSMDNGGTYD